jgi:cation transporter-like permease
MVMPSAHAYVQEISIQGIRQQVARIIRGSLVVLMPGVALIPLFQSIARDLPRFDMFAYLVGILVFAVYASSLFLYRAGYALVRWRKYRDRL